METKDAIQVVMYGAFLLAMYLCYREYLHYQQNKAEVATTIFVAAPAETEKEKPADVDA